MNALAGTSALVRLAVHRDRIMLPAWLTVFVGMAAMSAAATAELYPTVESRVSAAATANNSAALVALYGRVYDPTSLGAVSMMKLGGMGAAMVAVLTIFVVVRHTRAEEESGRQELLGATVVGRYAPLTAALLLAIGANLVLGLLTAVGLAAAGLPADGSLAFGLAWAGVGVAFAAITAVIAQLTTSARATIGLGSATLGAVYLIRAIGDTASADGPRWLSWLSPIGWGQQFRPYAGNRWWVLLITVGFAVLAMGIAYLLVARRDLGAGLVSDRPGRATGHPLLRSPLALAWRLHRVGLAGWVVGFALMGLILGNIASDVGGFLDSPEAREMFANLGGGAERQLSDLFLAAEMGIMGVIVSAYGISAALRLRSEETDLRAEPLLATAVSRTRWAASHLTVALLGVTALATTVGLAAGAAHAGRTGDAGQIGRVLAGALVQLPAAWLVTGIVVLLFGFAPRYVVGGWAALVAFLLLGTLGPTLQLDQSVMNFSPYTHLPKLPGGDLTLTPLAWLTGIAIVLIVAGLTGFRRRDVG
ncbi:MAG: ABC transporter permease [Micromonosporaceae bacterium]